MLFLFVFLKCLCLRIKCFKTSTEIDFQALRSHSSLCHKKQSFSGIFSLRNLCTEHFYTLRPICMFILLLCLMCYLLAVSYMLWRHSQKLCWLLSFSLEKNIDFSAVIEFHIDLAQKKCLNLFEALHPARNYSFQIIVYRKESEFSKNKYR